MPWKPGESGNPNGRSKLDSETLELRRIARSHTRSAMATILAIMRNTKNKAETRLEAAKTILDRGYGRPMQPVVNPDGTALNFGTMSDDDLLSLHTRTGAIIERSRARASEELQ